MSAHLGKRAAIAEAVCGRCNHCRGFFKLPGKPATHVDCEKAGRLSLLTGRCALNHWDARDLTSQPVVASAPSRLETLEDFRGRGGGRVLVILANGNSREDSPLILLKDKPHIDLMTINRPDWRVWPTRYWTFSDQTQLDQYLQEWRAFDGTIFNTSNLRLRKSGTISVGFSDRFQSDVRRGVALGVIDNGKMIGKTTTLMAMQIALYMDFDHVYVFGLDMARGDNGNLYAWGSNPVVRDAPREAKFFNEAKSFEAAAQRMTAQERGKFTICSSYNPWPFTAHFERLEHVSAPTEILRRHHPGRPIVCAITPTGDRPEAFALLERWVGRQDRPVDRWVVVDDGVVPTTTTRGQTYFRRTRGPHEGRHTLPLNLKLAMTSPAVRESDVVIFLEDDDYYRPDYVQWCIEHLGDQAMIGGGFTVHYNVASRRYVKLVHPHHASLCFTAIRTKDLLRAAGAIGDLDPSVDHRLWRAVGGRALSEDGSIPMTSIKGMPGRRGFMKQHKPDAEGMTADQDLNFLRQLLGEDAEQYARFYRNN